jgi:hypothetical protein
MLAMPDEAALLLQTGAAGGSADYYCQAPMFNIKQPRQSDCW